MAYVDKSKREELLNRHVNTEISCSISKTRTNVLLERFRFLPLDVVLGYSLAWASDGLVRLALVSSKLTSFELCIIHIYIQNKRTPLLASGVSCDSKVSALGKVLIISSL